MRRVRVGLVSLPSLLRDLVTTMLADDPALMVVPAGETADVVVTTASADAAGLLGRPAPRAVIALADEGRRAEVVDTVVRVRDLGEPDAAVLRATIHALAAGDPPRA